MMYTKLDFKFLERLLFAGEIVNICIRDIIGFTEEAIRNAIDDFHRQFIELLVRITHKPCVENMVIVSPTVETHQPKPHKILDFSRRWVYHSYNGFSFTLNLPVNKEKIREHLYIVEYQFRFIIF